MSKSLLRVSKDVAPSVHGVTLVDREQLNPRAGDQRSDERACVLDWRALDEAEIASLTRDRVDGTLKILDVSLGSRNDADGIDWSVSERATE